MVPEFLDVLHKRYAVFNEKDYIQKVSEKLSSIVCNKVVFKDDFSQIEKDFERLNKGLGPQILKLKDLKIVSVENVDLKDIYWLLYPASVARTLAVKGSADSEFFLEISRNLKRVENHAFFFKSFKELFKACNDLQILQRIPAYLFVPIKIFKLEVEFDNKREDIFRVYANAFLVKKNISFWEVKSEQVRNTNICVTNGNVFLFNL